MKFISYSHNGEHKFGILDNDLIKDLTGKNLAKDFWDGLGLK